MPRRSSYLVVLSIVLYSSYVSADVLKAAVASNFKETMVAVSRLYKKETGQKIQIISGSTGKLYTQSAHGAPFDMFFAADRTRPEKLVADGLAFADSATVYAIGKLVLLGNGPRFQGKDCEKELEAGRFRRLAIANPKTAPYGAAARQILQARGLWKSIGQKLVTGENISQTAQFVLTQNADMGFIAASLLATSGTVTTGCRWNVPQRFYTPIEQEVVILKKTGNRIPAEAFLRYFQQMPVQDLLKTHGYY